MPIGRIDLGPLSSREELVASIESGSWHARPNAAVGDVQVPDSARVGPYYGTVPQLRRRLRLLDLIPTQGMDSRSFAYSQESGSFDTAAETSEGAVKPQAELDLAEAEVIAKTIAHWIKLKRQQLDDVPSLATTVTQRLTYGVMRRVETRSSPATAWGAPARDPQHGRHRRCSVRGRGGADRPLARWHHRNDPRRRRAQRRGRQPGRLRGDVEEQSHG